MVSKPQPPTIEHSKAAQYVRMSTENQKYSTANQSSVIATYASLRGIDIVKTYSDEGRSGLSIAKRDGLKSLIDDVQSGRTGYGCILVYDVSRWGRFQDVDESAYYEFICRKNGVQVHYCADEFENDGSLASTILKNVKRVGAADFSRQLSKKVFVGQSHGVTLGFWQGAPAGYGLRRQLLDEKGKPKAVLRNGERKSLKSEKVVLVPGPRSEVRTIQRIFESFANRKMTRTEIAVQLNAEGILNSRGKHWTMQTIDNILRNEKYIGHMVYNRTSIKLGSTPVINPQEMWIRCDNAIKPIITPSLFARAQKVLNDLKNGRQLSDEELLNRLKALWRRKGHLTMEIMRSAREVPDWTVYQRRFGSILKAYDLIGFRPRKRYDFSRNGSRIDALICATAGEICQDVQRRGGNVTFLEELNLLLLNGTATLVVAVAWSVNDGALGPGGKRSRRWEVRKIKYRKSDVTLVIRLDAGNERVQDYFLVPTPDLALTKDRKKLRVSDRVFSRHIHHSLSAVLVALHARLDTRPLPSLEEFDPANRISPARLTTTKLPAPDQSKGKRSVRASR